MISIVMVESTTAVEALRASRISLGISQSRLARLSGVSRFKICLFELGDGSLSAEEQKEIRRALQTETDRLRNLPENVEFGESDPGVSAGRADCKGEMER
jgi:predicted transcriptional regulator